MMSFKEAQNKINERLYNTLCLLKSIYPSTSKFDDVFKKDMFIKSNKAAFYEVIYYLLNILNPQLTKESLKYWRPLDIKEETKFRNEVLQYVNKLNDLYKHACIPPIMSSHLISPGGYKFTVFMLKLSQLVVFEHLKKKHSDLLFCPETNNIITKRIINNLKKNTLVTESTREKLVRYHEYHKSQQEHASSIVKSLLQLNKKISASKKELAMAEEEFYKKYTVYPSNNSLKNKFSILNKEWQSLAHMHTLFEDSKSLLHYINNTNLIIDLHNETQQEVSPRDLDLPDFLNTLTLLINSKSLELPNPDSCFIQIESEKIQELTVKYAEIEKEILLRRERTQLAIKDMSENLKCIESLINIPESQDVVTNLISF